MKRFSFGLIPAMALAATVALTSCGKDDDPVVEPPMELDSAEFMYNFNNGQVIPEVYYEGTHSDLLTAKMNVEELEDGKTQITVELTNTVNGAMYMIHAHDAADASSTPNGTPYNEAPNGDVFVQMVTGNGGTVSISQTSEMTFEEITTSYNGFFVVHDPLQDISTTDLSTYIILGSFAREQAYTLNSTEYSYDFNTGQVAAAFAYEGTHPTNLGAKLRIQELGSGESRVTVVLDNSVNGEMYMIHAHDAADPASTPNGTPYNETPNGDLCALMATGNGASASASQTSSLSYATITASYDGFFVVHDPLQGISTTDPTTYVILGSFAK